jgi:DedD protein
MAFFKFRKRDDESNAPTGPMESADILRKRAKHRLIGTVVLVLAAVIGFPLLVDKQPRPISVDIPIEIPDKNKVKPLALPSEASPVVSVTHAAASGAVVDVVAPSVAPQVAIKSEVITESKPEPKAEAKTTEKTAEKPAEKSVTKEITKPAVKEVVKTSDKTPEKAPDKPLAKAAEKPTVDSAARALALLEGKEPPSAVSATEERLAVQVGAFADAGKAREARLKLDRAGLKTYIQEVHTKDGLRIRVRVGPFSSRAEADKAAEKIKKLDLPVSILTL